MKAVLGRLHPKPERKPDFEQQVGEALISAYIGMYNVEVFQERNGHMQRLQLSMDQWNTFKNKMHPNE
jgi:hypothetical protein